MIPLEQCALLPDRNQGKSAAGRRKTYAPACAIIALIIGFHVFKFPWMIGHVVDGDLYSVKALHASGVPVPLWWVNLILEWVMAPPGVWRYLIEKEADVNAPRQIEGDLRCV